MNRRSFLTTALAASAVVTTMSASAAESTTAGNKTLARRFAKDLWGAHDARLVDELLSPDFVNHNPLPGTEGNREGKKSDRCPPRRYVRVRNHGR
jgi:hypothetical protein